MEKTRGESRKGGAAAEMHSFPREGSSVLNAFKIKGTRSRNIDDSRS